MRHMMNMLEKARKERDRWNTIVEFLESFPRVVKLTQKRKEIIKSVTKKKKHWTQTPAGRKKMSESMKTRWKNGDFKGNGK